MSSRCLWYRSPLLWVVLCYAAGLVLARSGLSLPIPFCLGLALVFSGLSWMSAQRGYLVWGFFLGLGLLLAGDAGYQVHRLRLGTWEELPAREVRLLVRCKRVFPSDKNDKITALVTVLECDQHLRDLIGQGLYLNLRLDPKAAPPLRSSELRVLGVLTRVPFDPDPYVFDRYLSDAGINFRLSRGRVLGTVREPGLYYRFCHRAERRFFDILGLGIAKDRPELAGVLRAMVLGQQRELTETQNRLFIESGTMHLFAISGLHILAISVALYGLLGLLCLPRALHFGLCAVLLWLYVDITGATPSAIRAYVMVAAVGFALVVRRRINPLSTLCFATTLVLVFAPMQFFSASFQMSYGIVASLLLLGGPLSESWTQRSSRFSQVPELTRSFWQSCVDLSLRGLVSSLALGFTSILVGSISGVSYFRLLSPVSLWINLLLIPISSQVIYAGFASLVAGLLGLSWLSSVLNHAAALMLWFMEWSVQWALRLPGSHIKALFRWDACGGVLLTVLLGLLLWGYAKKWQLGRLSYWPPFALTALALALFVTYG